MELRQTIEVPPGAARFLCSQGDAPSYGDLCVGREEHGIGSRHDRDTHGGRCECGRRAGYIRLATTWLCGASRNVRPAAAADEDAMRCYLIEWRFASCWGSFTRARTLQRHVGVEGFSETIYPRERMMRGTGNVTTRSKCLDAKFSTAAWATRTGDGIIHERLRWEGGASHGSTSPRSTSIMQGSDLVHRDMYSL